MDAAQSGHVTTVQLLGNLGVDINRQDDSGMTALHWASALADQPDIVRCLAGLGADLHLRNMRGRTPLDYARVLGRNNTRDFLIKARSCGQTP
jgi:ankyrin repeat protein